MWRRLLLLETPGYREPWGSWFRYLIHLVSLDIKPCGQMAGRSSSVIELVSVPKGGTWLYVTMISHGKHFLIDILRDERHGRCFAHRYETPHLPQRPIPSPDPPHPTPIWHRDCETLFCGSFNTLRPRQYGRHFPNYIFKCIILNENVYISIKIWLEFVSKGTVNNIPALVKFVPKGPITNIPALLQIMVCRRRGETPLSEPMMA